MTTMITEVYDALIDAGASQEKARKAAETLSGYDSRFNKVESDLTVLKWMGGVVIAGVVALITKAFFHA